jgi:hypothetical protein
MALEGIPKSLYARNASEDAGTGAANDRSDVTEKIRQLLEREIAVGTLGEVSQKYLDSLREDEINHLAWSSPELIAALGEVGARVESDPLNPEKANVTLSDTHGNDIVFDYTPREAVDFLRSCLRVAEEETKGFEGTDTAGAVEAFIQEELKDLHASNEEVRKIAQAANTLPVPEPAGTTKATKDVSFAGTSASLAPENGKDSQNESLRIKETVPEVQEPKREITDFFEERFSTEFRITREQLQTIEGFELLSKAQHKLLYENFIQCVLGDVQEEAKRLCTLSEKVRKESMDRTLGTALGNAIAGFRDSVWGTPPAIAEKGLLVQKRARGFTEHAELLTQLVRAMVRSGPRVHEEFDGTLVVDLVNIRGRAPGKELRGEEWSVMEKLNKAAHAFARVPASWRGETVGAEHSMLASFVRERLFRSRDGQNQREYKTAKEQYTKAKGALESVLKKKGKNDREIAETLIGIDARVHGLQMLQTDPDAVNELAKIDDRNFWTESARRVTKNFTQGSGFYFALGFAGRSLLSLAPGLLGSSLASAGIAYARSLRQSSDELRARDHRATRGEKDTHEDALNVVNAEHLERQLTRLVLRCRQTSGDELTALLASLRARVAYTHEKQMLHQVNYGQQGWITNQTSLIEALSEAIVYLSEEQMAKGDEVNERAAIIGSELEKKLTRTKSAIAAPRNAERSSRARASARKAAVPTLSGFLVAEIYREIES